MPLRYGFSPQARCLPLSGILLPAVYCTRAADTSMTAMEILSSTCCISTGHSLLMLPKKLVVAFLPAKRNSTSEDSNTQTSITIPLLPTKYIVHRSNQDRFIPGSRVVSYRCDSPISDRKAYIKTPIIPSSSLVRSLVLRPVYITRRSHAYIGTSFRLSIQRRCKI